METATIPLPWPEKPGLYLMRDKWETKKCIAIRDDNPETGNPIFVVCLPIAEHGRLYREETEGWGASFERLNEATANAKGAPNA